VKERSDAALMEATLAAVAETGIDIRHTLFERFFSAYPERHPAFLNLDAASRRMTDETLQILVGLATDEGWVWPLVAELVATHRNYGMLPTDEYDAFIDLAIDELGRAAGRAWTGAHAAAWRRQGEILKAMIRRALAEWESAMPGGRAATPA